MKPLVLAVLVAIVACGSNPDPDPAPTPPDMGEAGESSMTTAPEKPTAAQLAEWCVQVEDSDSTCEPEPSSACRYDRGEVFMPRGCLCDEMFCERPAAFATTGYPGWCCGNE